jgi:predicted MFS family arabinose efflux permease
MVGMAVGGWMAGALFDATGGYTAAMWNGIAWNLVNLSIALWLLFRLRQARLQPA